MLPLGGLEGLGSIIVKLSTTKSHPILGPRCHLQTIQEERQNISPNPHHSSFLRSSAEK